MLTTGRVHSVGSAQAHELFSRMQSMILGWPSDDADDFARAGQDGI